MYSHSDPNDAYSKFAEIVQSEFQSCFPYTKLSRTKAKDKIWITKALRKSSKTKAKLYLKNGLLLKIYKTKLTINLIEMYFGRAAETENMYYKSIFNYKTNSVKQLWNNLNIVCSFKKCKTKDNKRSK